ncbi:MAG: DUF167 domain-containing protein [Longimicrobiales bacterium]|nr:DUF167 domain-containing protein [Longimicrobiales bacterium]
MTGPILRKVEGGVEIAVRVQPRASSSEVVGAYGDRAVKIRVAAPPVDGAANEELVSFLADLLGIPSRQVELVRGHGSRDKQIRVHGVSPSTARRRLGI